jgi:hypothetical protein
MAEVGPDGALWVIDWYNFVERGREDVLPLLAGCVREGKNPAAARHALWTMQGPGAFPASGGKWQAVLRAGLTHADASVRRAGVGVLPRTAESATLLTATRRGTSSRARRSRASTALRCR